MTVFNQLYANQYDTLYGDKDYAGECDLVEAALARLGRQAVHLLDVGCGTGGHVRELAGRGYQCTGVDLSPAMLEVARDKAQGLQPIPVFIEGDARSFTAPGLFDAAIMMFAVVSYLTSNDDVMAGLRNIRRHLSAGAVFMCDFWYGPAVLSVRPNERIRVLQTAEGARTIRAAATSVDSFHHTADVSFRLWSLEGDRLTGETSETHRMRYFFPQEFVFMLAQAGFTLTSLTAFPSLDRPVDDQTWNAFCVAEAT
jgi:SAM-dependent methyltransferase